MSNPVEKSGTGVHKSGTGVHKSGTGVHKSGTGSSPRLLLAGLAAGVMLLATGSTFADDLPQLMVTTEADHLMVSLHNESDVLVGAMPLDRGNSEYFRVPLWQALHVGADGSVMSPLVKASGSGSSDEGVRGKSDGLEVKASGSGASDESACGGGPRTQVKASGSGASDESVGRCSSVSPWGYAEIVFDANGKHVVIHQIDGDRLDEVLVAFFSTAPAASSGLPVPREFIARP